MYFIRPLDLWIKPFELIVKKNFRVGVSYTSWADVFERKLVEFSGVLLEVDTRWVGKSRDRVDFGTGVDLI